ncbi:hypothetical protein HPB52_001302 [Rhipicephalus sanguineus]|uniref:Uncharacterized protein n=1 Tax=Rhipicephalus sanguineus TaxID=34632 RepID=A0A9D4PYE5_RHISA|nr:hypothetical protein HPB52_001302 [Rhipicephalus sanguineus]
MCPVTAALPEVLPISKLKNRTALVTGAGSGIGRCVCEALAADGARVVAADCNLDSAVQTVLRLPAGTARHHAWHVDVTSKASVTSLFDHISNCPDLPPVSIVVCCAGIQRRGRVVDLKLEVFDQVIDVNLKGTFLTVQAAVNEMLARGVEQGSVVTVSSIAAVVAFTKTAALELAPHGIRCNVVLPGMVDTAMTATVSEKDRGIVSARTPLGRLGRPEEIARTIRYLCDEADSSFVTGASFEVTGGLHM